MNAQTQPNTLLIKLRKSSLFQTYKNAFFTATGHELGVTDDLEKAKREDFYVKITAGKESVLYLHADGGRSTVRGLVEAFSLQLKDEVNRAVVMPDEVEPASLMKAKSYIHQNLGNRIHLDDVASSIGLCSFQLCRLFKKYTRMTMTEYVSRKRVEHAKRKLGNSYCQITQIAYDVGFSSLSQFNRNFLKYTGESPTEYRAGLKQLEHCQFATV